MVSNEFWSRLYRIPSEGVVAGVCAGLARYFDWNVRLVRVIVVLLTIFTLGSVALIVYAALWYLMEPADRSSARPFVEAGGGAAAASTYSRSARPSDLKQRFARLEERLRGLEECVTSSELELRREFRKLEGSN